MIVMTRGREKNKSTREKTKQYSKSTSPQWSRQFVVEVNPLCGQRRSLLAQIGSSNNRITLRCKFLIAIDQISRKAYLKSNVVDRGEHSTPDPLPRQITIFPVDAIEHLHI